MTAKESTQFKLQWYLLTNSHNFLTPLETYVKSSNVHYWQTMVLSAYFYCLTTYKWSQFKGHWCRTDAHLSWFFFPKACFHTRKWKLEMAEAPDCVLMTQREKSFSLLTFSKFYSSKYCTLTFNIHTHTHRERSVGTFQYWNLLRDIY